MTATTHGLELGVSIGYLTLTQAATIKGCSTETLRSRVRAGVIPVHWLDQRTPLVRITGTAFAASVEVKVVDPNAPGWFEKLKQRLSSGE